MKTLLFCTSYAQTPQVWDRRYRKWRDFFAAGRLRADQTLLIDDGSPVLPSWRAVKLLEQLPERQAADKTVLYHFKDNLGRSGIRTYPGWYRSFAFAATYALRYGFAKVVHVESDCFIYSERMFDFVNGLDSGWTAFWCPLWQFPETCIQVICEDQFEAYAKLSTVSYAQELADKPIEMLLPFTQVRKDFVGDRYGEYVQWVPEDADYGCQIPEEWPA
jgi:hypothetical protein